MIGKVLRGNDVGGLLRYLFGPGRANEHTNPHVVAAWDDAVVAEQRADRPALRRLAALMEQPLAALEARRAPAVWHCPLRTAPGDRRLSDAEWAEVVADVLDRTGLAPRGDADGCRWVAVRHAEDHVHVAVTLARQDGRRARTPHDYVKVGAACRAAEVRYGLKVTPARDRTAPKRPTRAESEKAARQGRSETSRQRLRREVRRAALSSTDLGDFMARLQETGVHVRLRYSELDPTIVTGYAVADGVESTADGSLVWFGGAKLAPQLSLPRLEKGWAAIGHSEVPGGRAPSALPVRSRAAGSLRTAAVAARHLENGSLVLAAAAVVTAGSRTGARGR